MKKRIQLLKTLDCTVGPLLLRIFPRPNNNDILVGSIKKILVIRPGGMGDAALLLPALKAVKRTITGIKIDVLCESRNVAIFEVSPYVDNIYYYDRPRDVLRVLQRQYDMVFDTEQSHFLTTLLCRLLRANFKIGYATQARERLYHKALPYDHNRYEAESFWDLFAAVLHTCGAFQWDFPYFSSCREKNTRINQLVEADTPFICIFPGASIRERLWPESRWAKVADLLQDTGHEIVLLGGRSEVSICRRISRLTRTKKTLDFSDRLSLLETASLLENAALLVTTDSGILHVGVLCDAATVSLFGSGIASKWGPRGVKHRIINKNLPCSPCTLFGTTPACPNNMACMRAITSEEVAGACSELLESSSAEIQRPILQ